MAVSTVNPWAAGAVIFNTQPYAAFYERQMLRKQAKEDALDNYFKDLGKNVTSAGMRSQDVPVLLQKNKDWQQLYQQKRAEILDPKLDNGQAYSEYMRGLQDQLALTNESKGEAKKDNDLAKLRFNPEAKHIFDDPHFIAEKELDNLPIGDPRRKRFDLLTAALPLAPITAKDLKAHHDYLTGGVLFDEVPGKTENIGGFKTRTPVYTQYGINSQLQIGRHAMDEYDTDKRWRMEAVKAFKELETDPQLHAQYDQVHQQLYGSPVDTPREAWAIKGIMDNNMKAVKYETGDDKVGYARFMNDLQTASAEKLIRLKKEIDPNDTEMNNTWVENYLNKVMSKARADKKGLHYIYNHKLYNGKVWEIPQDNVIEKAFTRGSGKDMRSADKVYATEDGRIFPVFYQYGEDGKVKRNKAGGALVDEDYGGPLSLDQGKLALGYRGQTKKELAGTMEATTQPIPTNRQKSFTIDGRKVSREELKKSYTDEQIDEYIKLGLLK